MGRPGYSRAHYRRLSNGGPDAPGAAAERIAHRKAADQAHKEMLAKFAPLTPANAMDAIRWQDARIKELLSEGK